MSVAVGALQVAMVLMPEEVVKLMFCGQFVNTGRVVSVTQGLVKTHEPDVGLVNVKAKPPRCPFDKVKKPLPPNWSRFCPFAPVPT